MKIWKYFFENDGENRKSLKKVIENNLFIAKYAWKHTPLYLLLTLLIASTSEIVIFVEFTLGIKYVTDMVQYQGSFQDVMRFLIFLASGILVNITLTCIYRNYIKLKSREKLYKAIRMELYNKAVKIDLACYDNPEYYNEFVWCMNDVTKRIDQTTDCLWGLTASITVIITTGTFFAIYDVFGLFFALFSFAASFITNFALNKLKYLLDTELNQKQRKRSYIQRVFYMTEYAKELRLNNNIAPKLKKDFDGINEEILGIIRKYSKKQVVLGFFRDYLFNSFIFNGLYILYLVYLAAVKMTLSYGGVVSLLNSARRIRGNLMYVTDLIPQFYQNSMYIERIRSFLDYKEKVTEPAEPDMIPGEPRIIQLKNVSFSYSEKGENVLKDISLTIRPNEKIAFVGYNGAGKTTLIKLLMRLYDVTEGEILLDKTNIKDYCLKDYRDYYGAVFQDFQMFAASIAENVVMDDCKVQEEQNIYCALEKSGFSKKLSSLEDGIHTPLTREFESNGVSLSGGEAQKLAIARVFFKQCSVIILDEPSSALDPISEYHLNEAMLEAARDKTVIFISHRLSTTRMADRIYMLEKGAIIEEGSHDELMALDGKYAEMFNLQAEKYRSGMSHAVSE